MKYLFTLLISALFSIGFAQDFKQDWKEVVQLELDGKVKSAHEKVDAIYKKAKRKKYDDQIIRCFFYQSKFTQVTNENARDIILTNLKEEIKDSKGCKKALLNFIYASLLESYSQTYRSSINSRTTVKQNDTKDWKTWTSFDFDREIDLVFRDLLKDEKQLRATNIRDFAEIMDISPYTDTKTLSIYDFLLEKKLNYLFKNTYLSSSSKYENIGKEFFKKSTEFVDFRTDTLSDIGLKNLTELIQENERYCLKNNNTDIHVLQYDRMQRFTRFFPADDYYYLKIDELTQLTPNNYLLQDLKVDKAQYLYSKTHKGGEKNYYPEVLEITEKVLHTNENPNAKSEAETLKEKILGKQLALNIPDKLYQNQNYRAFVDYKNIDTIKVSYYKITYAVSELLDKDSPTYYMKNNVQYPYDKDSIVLDYIKKHDPFKTSFKILPAKTDHFNYSTEVLMDNLDLGNYLLYFETSNPLGHQETTPHAYHLVKVSNIDYVHEVQKGVDIFQAVNRKTGKPLENIIAKNNTETLKTNKEGLVNFKGEKYNSSTNYSKLLFISANDTLQNYYGKTTIDDYDNNEKFSAKAMVFFDRAIYRPGQKVYFKGFIFKNKNKTKSVVPYLTVHVTLSNADDDDVKEFDIQTNEFGSFTGEYDIPKNVMTGEFSLSVEEPDDYKADTKYYNKKEDDHAFWDNAEFDRYRKFTFKVEEYKRPTFEIKFDEIKENYTIGDTLKITGNAKTLAGSNLTNAKVAYTVSKRITETDGGYDSDNEFIKSETTTDADGNFRIEIVANDDDDTPLDEIEFINFTIKLEVTDLNGETRTAETYVSAGQKMLKLQCRINTKILQEEPGSFQIIATTLNNFPIPTKGTLTLYKQNQKQFLIKRNNYPEQSAINRSLFESLFPYEAYEKKDIELSESKVLTLHFDTEKTDNVVLDFLKKLELGDYRIILEAKDIKGHDIKAEGRFELNSKINNKPSQKALLTYNLLSSNNGFFVLEIRSVIPDLYVTTRMFYDAERKSMAVIQLKNGSGIIKFPKSANTTDDVQFHFSTVWENQFEENRLIINQEAIEPKLEFEISRMRNKIEPGSNENWSFVVKNSKLQAEVLASMYDTSLDQFATSNWNFENFYDGHFTSRVEHNRSSWYDNNIRFNELSFYHKYYLIRNPEPALEWFGFDFNSRTSYASKQYFRKFGPEASVPKSARTIYGVVTDNEGLPLPGANVFVKGTDRNTQTDFDGYYEIDAGNRETLTFSFIGMTDVSVPIDKQKNIDVKLTENNNRLDEVVITAYGFGKKSTALNASVSAETIFNRPNTTMLEALQGTLAGLSVGTNTSLIIRGVGSLDATIRPLYIIDGVPMSQEDMLKLNPADIKDLSILKEALATALYGSRAANGVILITTKKGVKELEQVKSRTNFNETAFFYPQLTADEKGQISFNFTTPESLTKWRLRLFAHNKKAQSGYFQTDIISQKDIMVMPNMPRFLREKDTINLAVKVVNMTSQSKTGNAILLLYDAATNNPVDAITLNKDNIKPFNCGSRQSVVVNWTISIPEGIQGLRYKVIAKSGNISDGEENILPVLTDKILITESIPIWVKGNTKREFTFTNLKNNTSTTLQNHALTIEYTSNPVWIALQSLPYLMNYPYECAEQTFAKYYGNCIAENILTQNPKVAALLDKWKNSKIPQSRLKLNEELKSIVLSETPWLMDAESEEQKNQRLALLMDINAVKENNQKALSRLETLMLPSGGFPWFSGGYENRYITQHILSGIGHLNTLFPADSPKYKNIVAKALPNLDNQMLVFYSKLKKYERPATADLNYLYMRSFFLKEYPFSKKMDSIIKLQLNYCKLDWHEYTLYQKGLLALVMHRYDEKEFAKKIITSLKETISSNEEIGMYWIENYNGYYWYESSIETQALLIEAFAEIDNDKEMIDAMKVWLIKNKQLSNWPTTKSTTEAIYALLHYGTDWSSIKENTKIKIGDEKILTKKLADKGDEMDAGYLKIKYDAKEIDSKMGTITVDNKTKVPGFGGVYWQYFETLENIKVDTTKALSIDKKLFKKVKDSQGNNELIAWNADPLKVGDLLTVRIIIKTDSDLEFVHLKDLRASCLEPVDVLSGYNWKDNLSYYKSTKDVATNFFFDSIRKGTYVLEYDLRVTNTGVFNSGISTLQSMYAPEYAAHSLNTKITVTQ